MGYFDDPNNIMALLNMSAGFGQAAMPSRMPVPTGSAIGMGAAGLGQGMQAGQQYTRGNIENQMAQLNLQRQQTLQPYQLDMMKKMMGGAAMPGSLNGGSASGNSGGSSVADQQFGTAYSLAMASGDMGKASQVLQSWAEHNPQLAGAIEQEKAKNNYHDTPGGPIFGIGGVPGAPSGTPAFNGLPSDGTAMPGIPPVSSSALTPPRSLDDIIAQQTGKTPNYNPMSTVSVAAAKKAAENALDISAAEPKAEEGERGKNIAESDKAVAAIIGRLPSAYDIIDSMTKLAPDVPSGPFVENQRDLLNAMKKPGATAYDRFNKFNENLFTQELPAIVQNSGGRIDIPLVKAIQGASQIPLDAQPKTKLQLLNDTKGLLAKVRDNALQNYKAQTGKDFDLGKAFAAPSDIKMAFQRGIIDKDTAVKLLQQNHGMQ